MKPIEMQVGQSHITLYRGDCLEIMPALEAGSVGVVVVDPPLFVEEPEAEPKPDEVSSDLPETFANIIAMQNRDVIM